MSTIIGGCLCGRIRYQSEGPVFGGGHCYCHDCRRSSGTAACSHLAVAAAGFELTGRPTGFTRPADSGNQVTRHFCPTCGSALYSTNAANPAVVFVRASSLDDPEVFRPQMIVYASRAPSWAQLDPGLPTFAEMAPASDRPVSLDP